MSHKRNHKCKSSTSSKSLQCKSDTTNTCTDQSTSCTVKTDCNTSTCPSTSNCSSTTSTCSSTPSSCSTQSCSTQSTCSPCSTSSCTSSSCSTSSCSSLTQTCCESSSSCSSSESSTSGSTFSEGCCVQPIEVLGKKKFKVTFGKKHCHKSDDLNCSDTAIFINGQQQPILKLQRGYEYYFSVKQDGCGDHKNFFVLTENPVGQIDGCPPKKLKNSFDPISKGCGKYYVNCCSPKYFYYQNFSGSFQGNLILVCD